MSDPAEKQPSFRATESGTFQFILVVTDRDFFVRSAPDTVTIRVNTPPVAHAGDDQEVNVGDQVQLDGSDSRDEDGDALTYEWTRLSGPVVTLSGRLTAQLTFTPGEAGEYTFELVVNDGQADSAPDTVAIRVNTPPVAHAGDDQTVNVGDQVQLDGSDSRDEDGDALTYEWTRLSGPVVTLSGRLTAQLTFIPEEAGEYIFELVVNDGQADSAPDTVAIRVNTPLEARAGDDQEVNVGDQVQLDGSGSTGPDGDALTYEWTRLSGPVVTLSGRTTAQLTFIPEEAGEYIFELVVNDGTVASELDEVVVRATEPEPSLDIQ